jgi:3-phosphoshikimate 1-carboxyvinyltransferase
MICAALAEGESQLRGVLDSEDTQVMIAALKQLGLQVEPLQTSADAWSVVGAGGQFPNRSGEIFVANSGTTVRFLAAALAAVGGDYVLDGIPRMRERPIADLVNALRQLGAEAEASSTGCPPVRTKGTGLKGGVAKVQGNISSQFLSGLLMAAPYANSDVRLDVVGELVSQPYVHMTMGVMRAFGGKVNATADLSSFSIPGSQKYRGTQYEIEPDASAASYFWGAAAITGGTVFVEGLNQESLQGDVAFCDCLRQMGCRVEYEANGTRVSGRAARGITVDMNAISDTVQTLAAVALFADGPTTITGVGHIRHKETDRIGDLARELRKLGATVDERETGLTIVPKPLTGCALDTYNDHRMAMSLALVGLALPGVVINNPGCTVKTYPQFFADFERVCREKV